MKKILYKKEISIDDLVYISKLINTNLSLYQTFELLENNKNKKIFQTITSQLNDGKMIEDIIGDYLPNQIKAYMLPLLKKMSFSSALSLSLDFYENHKQNENKLISGIAYPCILFFVSITALYLFDLYGMDTIFSLIDNFNVGISSFNMMRLIFRVLIKTIYYLVLIGVIAIIYLIQPKRITLAYVFFSKKFPNSLISVYYSEEFISLLLICINKGYKTKESLSILKNMKTKPIISFLAFNIDESLLNGETLKKASENEYYDLSLSRFIKIANYTNDFSNMLDSYVVLTKDKIIRIMKKYTIYIQLSTYFFIGVIIIFIYQILFIPMQALTVF